MEEYFASHAVTLAVLLTLWVLPWKAVALWRAARNGQKAWFAALLVLNTLAVLEIAYVFFFSKMKGNGTSSTEPVYTEKIMRAIKFAAKTHNHYQDQTRKGKKIPYIAHPLTAGIMLARAGASEDVVVAGILHDVVEDCAEDKKVTPGMLTERFGPKVTELVMSVTETDKSLPWEDRKAQALEHITRFSHDSLLVKSADVLSNVTELLDDHARSGDEVFGRFAVPKEVTLRNQLKVIDAILARWEGNPLALDLRAAADGLRKFGEVEESAGDNIR